MYALMYIGMLLEPVLGRTKFIVGYLLCGITASTISLWWHDYTVSAGASGAIFGLYGIFLALLSTNLIEKNVRSSFLSSISIFVIYNLTIGMKAGIDNAAHIGGLAGGVFTGYCFYFPLRRPESKSLDQAVVICCAIIIIMFSTLMCFTSKNDIGIYTQQMEQFRTNEEAAMEIYRLHDSVSKKTVLKTINKGIGIWYDNIALLRKSASLNLPDHLILQIRLLGRYCSYRVNCYRLMYRSIEEENPEKYSERIESYNQQIEQVLSEINSNP
jgi:rhomboid protease GluP